MGGSWAALGWEFLAQRLDTGRGETWQETSVQGRRPVTGTSLGDRGFAVGTAAHKGRRFLEDWPGLSGEAAEYLVGKNVSLVGCDTLAIDATVSTKNPAHYALLGKEVYIVENLNNLDRLPPFCHFLALPLKIRDGSGSPVRAVALVPR